MKRGFVVCLVCLIAALVSACATAPNVARAPTVSDLVTSGAPQTARQYWLSGRLSVRINDRLDIAKIVWTRNANDENLQVFTPFGSQIADLTRGNNGRVTLKQG